MRGAAVEDRNAHRHADEFAAVLAELGAEGGLLRAVDARAVASAQRKRGVERGLGDPDGIFGAFEPQAFRLDVGAVFRRIGIDVVGRAEHVQRCERHAVELRRHDVESRRALAVEGLTQVEQRQPQVVAGLRQIQFVVGLQGFAFVACRFGLFARGDQLAAADGLLGAQFELAFGDLGQLLVVENLQVQRHDVD